MKKYYIFIALLFLFSIAAGVAQSILSVDARYDQQTVDDFSRISAAVDDYASDKQRLPFTLDELDLSDEVRKRAKERNYEYREKTDTEYELCAEFRTDESSSGNYYDGRSAYNHGKGRQCFDYTAYSINPPIID